jgi:hypothetical protein
VCARVGRGRIGRRAAVDDEGGADISAMALRHLALVVTAIALPVAALGGCVGGLEPRAIPCDEDAACLGDQRCHSGVCTAAATSEACLSDLDCDPRAGTLCRGGVCVASTEEARAGCSGTEECPLDQQCNAATSFCVGLPAGSCRVPEQCGGASPLCDAASPAVPGRCVACLSEAECGGDACIDGACAVEPALQCQANASPVPGSTTECRCITGFVLDAASGRCAPAPAPDDEDSAASCPENASPDPAAPGACLCRAGFEPSASGACVPLGTADDEECPPHSTPHPTDDRFCFCDQGFVPDEAGDECVPELECPPGSSPAPDLPGLCECDEGLVVSFFGTACIEDFCAVNGLYGDGLFCDFLCPLPDPDCG